MAATTPETVSHDDLVRLQVEVPDSMQRYIKASAVLKGQTMGDFIADLIRHNTDYVAPVLPKRKAS